MASKSTQWKREGWRPHDQGRCRCKHCDAVVPTHAAKRKAHLAACEFRPGRRFEFAGLPAVVCRKTILVDMRNTAKVKDRLTPVDLRAMRDAGTSDGKGNLSLPIAVLRTMNA
jgi:hypothetical protein